MNLKAVLSKVYIQLKNMCVPPTVIIFHKYQSHILLGMRGIHEKIGTTVLY